LAVHRCSIVENALFCAFAAPKTRTNIVPAERHPSFPRLDIRSAALRPGGPRLLRRDFRTAGFQSNFESEIRNEKGDPKVA
jgi:hypothetical protein